MRGIDLGAIFLASGRLFFAGRDTNKLQSRLLPIQGVHPMTHRSSYPVLNVMLLAVMFGFVGWARLREPIPVLVRVRRRP
jgi:hypothetical protein